MNKFEKVCWSWAKRDWNEIPCEHEHLIYFTLHDMYKEYKYTMRQLGSSIEDIRTLRDSGSVVR